MKNSFLEAGKIVNTHGVRGEVKIVPWADSAEFLQTFETFFIDGNAVKLITGRVHKGCLIAKLSGVDDVNAAMALKNKVVSIDRGDIELPDGRFFIADIIGARVVSETGEELGCLREVLDLPAGNVYVVEGKREIMIPAVEEFILSTDAENGLITVRLIEGM